MSRAIVDGQSLVAAVSGGGGGGGSGVFGGNGALGDVVISSPTDMLGLLNYNNLTITTSGTLSATAGAPLQVLVKGNLVLQGVGALHADGRGTGIPGTGGVGGNAVLNNATNPGTVGTAASAPAGFNPTVFTASGGGGGGGGGSYVAPSTFTAMPASPAGRDRDSSYLTSVFGAPSGGQGASGAGATDPGVGAGNPGFAGGAATPADAGLKAHIEGTGLRDWHLLLNGGASGAGGNGGSGAANTNIAPTSGGAGGVPGSQAGANLGVGGTGVAGVIPVPNNQGGGGGGGAGGYGGGGLYVEVAGDVDLDAGTRISADGAAGGIGGAGGADGATGNGGGGGGGGSAGGGGWVALFYAGADVQTTVDAVRVHSSGGAGGVGGTSAGIVPGGAGGNGGAGEAGYAVFRKVA